MQMPSGEADFTVEPVTGRVLRLRDALGVCMYLVIGTRRAALVDTGHGVGDLGAFVAGLTDRPVTVLLTHGHIDHAFGASWFDDVLMDPRDLPVLGAHQALSAGLIADARRQGHPVAEAPDPATFGRLSPDDRLDLGGLAIRVLEASGHTPGSVALLIEEERLLITGDAANQFTYLFHPEAATVEQFRKQLGRLRAASDGLYDRVCVSHGPGDAPRHLLDDLDRLAGRVLARTDDAVPFEFNGDSGRIARRAAGDEPHDDDANLVYNPLRLA